MQGKEIGPNFLGAPQLANITPKNTPVHFLHFQSTCWSLDGLKPLHSYPPSFQKLLIKTSPQNPSASAFATMNTAALFDLDADIGSDEDEDFDENAPRKPKKTNGELEDSSEEEDDDDDEEAQQEVCAVIISLELVAY